MANTLSLVSAQRMLDWLLTGGTPTRPTAWFAAAHTGANGGSGANNEIAGNGYARQTVVFTRSGQTMANSASCAFGPDATSAWGGVTDVSIWDAATAGNCLAQGTVSLGGTYALGESAVIPAGALTITVA